MRSTTEIIDIHHRYRGSQVGSLDGSHHHPLSITSCRLAAKRSRGKEESRGVDKPMKMVKEEEIILEKAKKWIEELGNRVTRSHHGIEYLSLCGIQVLQARKGWILCNLKLHPHLADRSGNCHVGAIATIIDVVGGTVISTWEGDIKISVDFNISYFATVKIQEEVEIEGKVVAHRGKLSLTVVEIKRKEDGVLVAIGKQWMAQVGSGKSFRTKL